MQAQSRRRGQEARARRWRGAAAVVLVLLATAMAARGGTQDSETEALKKRVQALEAKQRTLEAEVQELRRLLGKSAAPGQTVPAAPTPTAPPAVTSVMNIAGAPFKGHRNAAVTLVEFSDYQCGFCGRHSRETLPLLDENYIQRGKLKYVFRSFPNEATHKLALKAHEAAACAGDHGKYWPMHDRLFARPGALEPAALPLHAEALAVPLAEFQRCLASSKYRDAIRRDLAAGRAAGVTATPTFFLGVKGANDDQVAIVRVIRGAKSFTVFKTAIDQLLSSAGS